MELTLLSFSMIPVFLSDSETNYKLLNCQSMLSRWLISVRQLLFFVCIEVFPWFFLQRSWLLKLLAIELHIGDMSSSNHREACQSILAHLLGGKVVGIGTDGDVSHSPSLKNGAEYTGTRTISKSKVWFVTSMFYVSSKATVNLPYIFAYHWVYIAIFSILSFQSLRHQNETETVSFPWHPNSTFERRVGGGGVQGPGGWFYDMGFKR